MSATIADWNELCNDYVYKKVKLSFIDKKLGLADAGYSGLKYTMYVDIFLLHSIVLYSLWLIWITQ